LTGALRGSSAKSHFGCEEAITQTRIKNEKSPAEIPRGFVLNFVKRMKRIFAHDLIRKPEDHPRIKSEGKLFGIMRYPSLAGLAASYSSKP
jgi:hypothetical protein